MRRRLRAALALAVLLQLMACATRPPADEASPWTSGKLSLRVDALADKPARSVNASFDLRGSGQRGELRLMSSLGTIVASARWSADRAVLQTGDGEREYADLEALSQDALGEALPLRALPDWLAGRAWPGAATRPLAGPGFEQLGWHMDLARSAKAPWWPRARRRRWW